MILIRFDSICKGSISLRHDLLKTIRRVARLTGIKSRGRRGKKSEPLVYRRQVDNGTRYGVVRCKMVPPLVWRPNIVARRTNEISSALFFNLWIAYMNRNTITANGTHVSVVSTIWPRFDHCSLSPFPSFLIATNLCEIVNIALILRFVILISIEYFTPIDYLFYRSKKNWILNKILFITKNRSSRLFLTYSFSLSLSLFKMLIIQIIRRRRSIEGSRIVI